MGKTRFSDREKKILLFLLQNDGDSQNIKKIFALDPVKTYSRTLKSGEVWEHRYRSKGSIRRTLLILRKNGYIKSRRGGSNWSFFRLTDKGREKANELHGEITAYIEEWSPLVDAVLGTIQ